MQQFQSFGLQAHPCWSGKDAITTTLCVSAYVFKRRVQTQCFCYTQKRIYAQTIRSMANEITPLDL